MGNQKEFWNRAFNNERIKHHYNLKTERFTYHNDRWLEKYKDLLKKSSDLPIIDLGCGFGRDSAYLVSEKFNVIACDFSEIALEMVKQNVPKAEIMMFDILKGLPFKNESIKAIIADLSIHYFCWTDTENVIRDIYRVLKPGGVLLFRVNSTADKNYATMEGRKIENNYYEINGKRVRLFDRADIEVLFSQWEIEGLKEYEVNYYRKVKTIWEAAIIKREISDVY